MSPRLKIPLALLVAAGALGWLVAAGIARNDLYVSTLAQFDEARARRQSVRVMGFVSEGTVREVRDALVTEFVVRDEARARSIPVRYEGVTPSMFREGASVIVTGRLREDGVFAATDLMTKCPSKYEGMETPHGQAATPPAEEASSSGAPQQHPGPAVAPPGA